MNNDTNPRVSICVPVYNGGAYLSATLDSLVQQTVSDIEIIVSDNASTDETSLILTRYAEWDSRIVVFRNPENIGYIRNIWSAVSQAKAPYVAIFHADDLYHPQTVERELALLTSDPALAGVFCHPQTFTRDPKAPVRKSFYQNLHRIAPFEPLKKAIIGDYEQYLPLILRFGNFFACPSFLTRKEVFLSLGGFTDKYPSNEDFELWIKYLKAGWKLGIVDAFLLSYRQTATQSSAIWRKKPELGKMYDVLAEMVVTDRVLSLQQSRDYRCNRAVGFSRVAVQMAVQGNVVAANLFAKKSRKEARLLLTSFWGIAQYFPQLAGWVYVNQGRLVRW